MRENEKTSKKDVRMKVWIKASPKRVYRALTKAEDLARWFVNEAEADPRVGGRLKLTWTDIGSGDYRFLNLVPGREVVISWEKGSKIDFRLSSQKRWHAHPAHACRCAVCRQGTGLLHGMVSGRTMNICKLKSVLEKGWDL